MADGLVAAIWRSYRDPRGVMAGRIAEGLSEARAQRDLWLACGLFFVASTPNAVRQAQALEIDDPVAGAVAAHLFGYGFVAPLLFYVLAAALHLVARAFGGAGGYLGARSALFWTAVLGGPIALALALASVAVEIVAGAGLAAPMAYLNMLGFAFWLWLLSGALAEVEDFSHTHRVAGILLLGCFGVWAGLGAVTGAGLG